MRALSVKFSHVNVVPGAGSETTEDSTPADPQYQVRRLVTEHY